MRTLLPCILAALTACCGVTPPPPVAVRMDGEIAEIIRGGPGEETVLALFQGVHRWAAGDVTGDGQTELVILWSLPDRPPRVWVILPNDAGVTPIWRGSGMAGVPLDLALRPGADGDTELLVLEDWGSSFSLVLYQWDTFGFKGIAWGTVGAGALAPMSDGATGYLPEGDETPCPLERADRQLLVRCPRK